MNACSDRNFSVILQRTKVVNNYAMSGQSRDFCVANDFLLKKTRPTSLELKRSEIPARQSLSLVVKTKTKTAKERSREQDRGLEDYIPAAR